jgi:hypothetical protein
MPTSVTTAVTLRAGVRSYNGLRISRFVAGSGEPAMTSDERGIDGGNGASTDGGAAMKYTPSDQRLTVCKT